jgi:hypothetical protein
VGIGTSSPTELLQINTTQPSDAGFKISTSSDGWVFKTAYAANNDIDLTISSENSGVSPVERLRIDSSGNLGLGVTPSAWTIRALQVSSTSLSSDSNDAYLTANGFFDGSWKYVNTDFATQYYQLNGTHVWRTAPSGTAGAAITFTQAMTLDASGNLGIGTTSPTFTSGSGLEIERTDANATVRLQRAGTSPSSMEIRSGANTGEIFVTSNSPLLFATNGTERARIDASGNVQVQAGAVVVWAPAPASISTTATLTNANIQGQIINTTGTSYTVTMPLGTTLETLVSWASTNLGYDFTVINTASGTITMAINTGVTSLGGLTIATGTSAQFRIRRTATNTFVLYRMG